MASLLAARAGEEEINDLVLGIVRRVDGADSRLAQLLLAVAKKRFVGVNHQFGRHGRGPLGPDKALSPASL